MLYNKGKCTEKQKAQKSGKRYEYLIYIRQKNKKTCNRKLEKINVGGEI